jgi:hypothetical protein
VSPAENTVLRLLKGFGRFWWDFLVGDTPELFVSTIILIGITFLLGRGLHNSHVATVVLPIFVVASLALTVARSRPKKGSK